MSNKQNDILYEQLNETMPSQKQLSYIIYAFKSNKWNYKELEDLFPSEIKDGVDIRYKKMEEDINKLTAYQAIDVIGYLKDDMIVEGFQQLKHLITKQ